jgi:hypothetical protein
MGKAGRYYFDRDLQLLGREMEEDEIKSLSHEQFLEVALGKWESNGWLFNGPLVLKRADGSLITYVDVDIYNNGGEPYESLSVEIKEGENPKTVFRNEYSHLFKQAKRK